MVDATRPARAQLNVPDDTATDNPITCPRCAHLNAQANNFCAHCGFNLSGGQADIDDRDPLIGIVIADRYRLLSKLGTGGMGTVFKVEHIRMGKLMAMKLLHGKLSRDATMVRRFTREARAASRLINPHAVQCFDFGHDNGLFFIVMELLRGRDLGALVDERGALSVDKTLIMLDDVCQALSEAHDKHIVHRDLKPENIFVCAAGQHERELFKVLDFGLAKLRERKDSLINTQQGSIMGTPYYMSPEQIQGEDVDHLTDVYSLGALLFKLLTGHPPFMGRNPMRVLYRHLHDPIPKISERRPDLADLDGFFELALAKDPRHRFQSVQALRNAFHAAAEPIVQAQPKQPSFTALPAATDVDAVVDDDAHGETMELEGGYERLLPEIEIDLEELAGREDFGRYERVLRFRRFARGVFFIVLLLGGVWLIYWGVVLDNFFDRSMEDEPNDTTKNANPVVFGQPISARLGDEDRPRKNPDRDIFRVDADVPNQVIKAKLTGIPAVDLVLEVVNMRGERLLMQNANSAGFGEVIPNYPIPESEPLFLVVRELRQQGKSPQATPDVRYSLVVEARQPMPGEELEPNNTLERASSVGAKQVALGMITNPDDEDVYWLRDMLSDEPFELTVRVSPLRQTDLVLSVENAAQTLSTRVDDAGLGEGETLRVSIDPSQDLAPYYVRVRSRRGYHSFKHYQLSHETARQETVSKAGTLRTVLDGAVQGAVRGALSADNKREQAPDR